MLSQESPGDRSVPNSGKGHPIAHLPRQLMQPRVGSKSKGRERNRRLRPSETRPSPLLSPTPRPGSGSTCLFPQDLLCRMGERVSSTSALPMCGGDGTCQLLPRAHAGVSDTAPAPPRDGGGSRLFRGLLRSQGTCVRTVTSPGYGERLFIGSYCLSSRVAGCLVHLCTSTTDTGSDEHTRDCTCLLGTCA